MYKYTTTWDELETTSTAGYPSNPVFIFCPMTTKQIAIMKIQLQPFYMACNWKEIKHEH